MPLSYLVSYIIVIKIDNNYKLLNKINMKIPICKKWKPTLYITFYFMCIILIALCGLFSDITINILNGVLLSIIINLTQENSKINKA